MNMDLLKQKRADYFARKLSKINASLAASRARGPVQNEGEETGAGEEPAGRGLSRQEGSAGEGPGESGFAQSPENYMIRCPKCGKQVNRQRVVKRKYICYECEGYFRVKTSNRIRHHADAVGGDRKSVV